LETYNVTVEPNHCEIIVRTTNKKYFKKLKIQELERCQLKPEQESVTTKHQHNTLIIAYKKPALIKDMEAAVLEILNEVEVLDSLNFDIDELLEDLN
jgi:protein DPCD